MNLGTMTTGFAWHITDLTWQIRRAAMESTQWATAALDRRVLGCASVGNASVELPQVGLAMSETYASQPRRAE